MSPVCIGVIALLAATCRLARPSGPTILSHRRSIRCRAIFWPLSSRVFE